jgi:hypothetical protein
VGFRAGTTRFPEQGLAVSVICNVSEVSAGDLAAQVADIYLADKFVPETLPALQAVSAESLAGLVGTWADTSQVRMLEITSEDGELLVDTGRDPWKVARSADGSGGLVMFRGDSRRSVNLVQDSEGNTSALELTAEGRQPSVFRRAARVEPGADELAHYVGAYKSEELGVIWRVVQDDEGALSLRLRPLDDEPLEPAYEDAFSWGWGHAVFKRDADGEIIGMYMGTGRASRLWMQRVGKSAD